MINIEELQAETQKAIVQREIRERKQKLVATKKKQEDIKTFYDNIVDTVRRTAKTGRWDVEYEVPSNLCYEIMALLPELKPREICSGNGLSKLAFHWQPASTSTAPSSDKK